MENKMTLAVLLSLMAVAGLATTDAYAQSNSERIAAIQENTEDIQDDLGTVSDSVGSLASMVSAVQTSLADLVTLVNDAIASISNVQTSVNNVAGEVSQINSKISNIDSALGALSALDARLTSIEDRIGTLQNTVSAMDDGEDVAVVQSLAAVNSRLDVTNAQIKDIFDRLLLIEAGLQDTNQKISQPAPDPSPTTNILLEGETELNVDSYDYVKHGDATIDRGPAFYELDMTFSCNKNVFLDQVDLFQHQDVGDRLDHVGVSADNDDGADGNSVADADDGTPNNTTPNNYVRVDNRDLYNNAFHTGGSTYAELDLAVKFNNKLLRAGETLKFESKLFEGQFRFNGSDSDGAFATAIEYDGQLFPHGNDPAVVANFVQLFNGSTRDMNYPLYEINVDWVASESGVSCSLNFGTTGDTVPGLTSSQSLTYGVTIDKADAKQPLKKFKDTIDCDGNPVEITEISAGTLDTWRLAGFANVVLKLGSDEYKLKFDADSDTPVVTNADDILPLYVGNEDLTISGTIPVENLLLVLKYNTIPNAECEAVAHAPYQ